MNTQKVYKASKKIDEPTVKRISDYLDGVVASNNPRSAGRPLLGNKEAYWRYRVGDYHIIAEIHDSKMVVIAVEAGHHRDIYRQMTRISC